MIGLLAQQRFPRPDLGPQYVDPLASGALPRALLLGWIDLAALVVALSLAAWLTLRRRSRRGVFWLSVACLGYFGFYREGCVCPIGSIQNVVLGLCSPGYTVPLLVTAFFFLPLLFALFFGRVFCSGVCPLGAIQDLVLLRPLVVPRPLEAALGLLRHLYLGAAVLFAATASAFIICEYDPFVAFFRLTGKQSMLLLGAALLGIGVFIDRPYCRYLCPYGVLLGWLSRFSRHRVTITPADCVTCHLCAEQACPFGAITPPTARSALLDPHRGKLRLALLLLLAPLLTGLAGWLGWRAGDRMSRVNPRVRLLDDVERTAREQLREPPDTVVAFSGSGGRVEELREEAASIGRRFTGGGALMFAFVALALCATLLRHAVRRVQPSYEAERSSCLACARCYVYCPVEHSARGAPLPFHDVAQV